MRAWRAFAVTMASVMGLTSVLAADVAPIVEDFGQPPSVKGKEASFAGLSYRGDNNPGGEFSLVPGGIRLTVRPGANPDAKRGEGGLYDRSELRELRRLYLKPGTPVWYRFAMRTDPALKQSVIRFVAFQMKTSFLAYDDAHPVFAMRIEGGRLFATLEVLSDPARPVATSLVGPGGCPAGTALGRLDEPAAPQVAVLFALDAAGLPQHRTAQFDRCVDQVTVQQVAPLPSPESGWIDFELFLQTGPGGAAELHANGQLIATAKGPFGDGNPAGDQYLKLGPYRDKEATTAWLEFARFRRGATRADVAGPR